MGRWDTGCPGKGKDKGRERRSPYSEEEDARKPFRGMKKQRKERGGHGGAEGSKRVLPGVKCSIP